MWGQIYPGLKLDIGEVEAAYRNFLASSFEKDTLKPWVSQYSKDSQIAYNAQEVYRVDACSICLILLMDGSELYQWIC